MTPPFTSHRTDVGGKLRPRAARGSITRRGFLAGAVAVLPTAVSARLPLRAAMRRGEDNEREPLFRISLAEWSLHRTLGAGDLDHLDFPGVARTEYGIDAVEYVNSFFRDKTNDRSYLRELKTRCDDHGVRSLLIMCDGEGAIGDPDPVERTRAVENHYRWVDAARFLGCHSIRVNAQSAGTPEQQRDLAADGLRRLTEHAAALDINVIVENHGGLSSNGAWLAGVMETVEHPRCGTLPDGWIGIEYEGTDVSEPQGIRATKKLLERVRSTLESEMG
jgi:hypothetical protein